MKAFNIIALSLGGALLSVLFLSYVSELIFGEDIAKFLVIGPALIIGMSARRTVEKILGYTLLEALRGDDENTST